LLNFHISVSSKSLVHSQVYYSCHMNCYNKNIHSIYLSQAEKFQKPKWVLFFEKPCTLIYLKTGLTIFCYLYSTGTSLYFTNKLSLANVVHLERKMSRFFVLRGCSTLFRALSKWIYVKLRYSRSLF
jgi:hypothetical protein